MVGANVGQDAVTLAGMLHHVCCDSLGQSGKMRRRQRDQLLIKVKMKFLDALALTYMLVWCTVDAVVFENLSFHLMLRTGLRPHCHNAFCKMCWPLRSIGMETDRAFNKTKHPRTLRYLC